MATFKGDDFKFPDENSVQTTTELPDVEIEIEDDTPAEDRGRKAAPPPEDPTDDELSSYDEKVQARIKKFTRGYHDERRAKEAAERERLAAEEFARSVFDENKRLKEQLEFGSRAYIEQNKSATQTELDVAKRKFKEAFESGDAEKLSDAQEEVAKATLRMDRAASMQPVQASQEEFKLPQRQAPAMPSATQDWVEQNSDWFGKDDEMTMAAMGLDKKLQKQYGADYIGTEDYFRTIDSVMKKRFPEHFGSHEESDDPPQNTSTPAYEGIPPRRASKPATVVAPAARSTPPNRVRLKESQVALSRKLGITPEQYAKQVALLGRNS